MALHPRINPDPIESIAQTAHMALMTARKTQTRRSGTSYWGMSDGTGIILGDDARDGVNRYEPDTGVQLPLVDTSGIESQISQADNRITNITQQITDIDTKLADTNKAIDAQAAKMQTQVQAITAQAAKDKAALDDSVSALGKRMSAVENTADDLGKHVTDVQATVNGQASTLTAFDQRISANASSGAATAKLASSLQQTVQSLSATLTQTTKTANDALTQANTVQATAKQISDTLTTDYTTSKDSDAKYATQAALKATSDSVSAQFAAQAETNKGYDTQIASIQATAQGITQRLSDVAKTANSTQTTVTTLKQTVDGNTSQIKQTTDTAQGLLTKTQQLSNSIDGLKLNLTSNYATKTEVANISVGGTNLLLGTSTPAMCKGDASKKYVFNSAYKFVKPLGQIGAGQYTLSFDYEYTGTLPTDKRAGFYPQPNVGPWIFYNYIPITTTGEVQHYTATINVDNTSKQPVFGFRLDYLPGTLTISNCKIERGNKPTDWSPAPQDLQPAGDYATSSQVEQTAQGLSARINTTTTTIAGIQRDVNSIKVDATGIHGTLTQITDSQGVTNKTVKSIQDTVSGLQSTLTSTTKTANSALTNTTTLKTGLDSVNLTMSQHYQQMLANTQMGENLIPNGNADPNAEPFNGWKINQHAYEVVFPGEQSHVDFLHYNLTRPIPKGHTYRFSMQVRVTSGTCSGSDYIAWGFGSNWTWNGIVNLAGVGTNWELVTYDITTPGDENQIFMSSWIGSTGAKTLQFRALSVVDITPAAQAQSKAGDAYNRAASVSADLTGFKTSVSQTYLPKSDAANTYTTSSQVEQTAKQISAQVVSDYKGADGSGLATQSSLAATKKDILAQVSQTYTTKDGVTQQLNSEIQQTATSLTTTFTNQINKTNGNVQKLSSYIHEDANGITLGRQGTSTPTVHLDTGGVMGLATPNGKFAISFEQKSKGTFRGGTDTYHDAIVGGIGAVYGTESMDQGIGIRFGRYFDSNNRLNSAFTVRQNDVDLFEVDRVYKGHDLESGVSSSGITTNTQIIALNGIDPKFGVTLNGDRIDPRPLDLHEIFPAMSIGVTLDPSSWAFQIGHLVIAQIRFNLSKQIYDNVNFVRLAFVNRLYFPDEYTAVGGTSGECAGGLHVLTKPASGMQSYLAYFRRSDYKHDIPYVYGNFMFKSSIASY